MNATTKTALRVHVRWLIRRDMPRVTAIEAASSDPAWTADDFLRCLRQRNCIGMVAEHGDGVVGLMVYELHPARLDLLNFAVAPACRRLGVGGQMARKLTGKLSTHRRSRVTLAVRESNLPAQLFFAGHGFRAVRVLRGYYGDEDAYRMEHRAGPDMPADDTPANRVAQFEEDGP